MTTPRIGINLEFVRHADKSFEHGGRRAAEMGYRYIEPCFLMGTCLLSNAGYCHIRSLDTDPHYFKDFCQQYGVEDFGRQLAFGPAGHADRRGVRPARA